MTKLFFHSNRKKVQQYFEREQFIIPISTDKLIITEPKNTQPHQLQKLVISDVPSDYPYISWQIDLEKEHYAFSPPESKKRCDTALLTMINGRLYVFMIEMKTTITNNDSGSSLKAIEQKFVDTMERISILLTVNKHENITNHKDELIYQNTQIIYKGIVCYNKDTVSVVVDELKKTPIYKILKESHTPARIYPGSLLMGTASRIDIRFLKNPKVDAEMSIKFSQMFEKQIKFLGPAC